MPEAEALLDLLRQVAIEDPQDHGHLAPALPEQIPSHQRRLDVGEVIAAQHHHRGSVREIDHRQCLTERGVADHDRDPEGAGAPQVAARVVTLDDDHLAAAGDDALDDVNPQRAEPDDHGMARHPCDLSATKRLVDPPPDQEVGEEDEGHRGQRHPEHDEDDGEDLHPSRLMGEGEVAESDRRHGLDHEVERGEGTEAMRCRGRAVAELDDDGRDDDQREDRTQRQEDAPRAAPAEH